MAEQVLWVSPKGCRLIEVDWREVVEEIERRGNDFRSFDFEKFRRINYEELSLIL